MDWIIYFYHTESMYLAGIVSFTLKRSGSREDVIMEAGNLAQERKDAVFEVKQA